MPRRMFERTQETIKLVSYFTEMKLLSSVTWEEASKAIGIKITRKSSCYDSARRIATKDHGIVVETLRCYGFQRTDAAGISHRINKGFTGIRRRAKWHAREAVVGMQQTNDRATQLVLDEQYKRARILSDVAQPIRSNRTQNETPPRAQEMDARAAIRAMPID